jgi:hypothetical protein
MSRMKSGTVAVHGLDELRRELKKLDGNAATEALKDANYRVAELVVQAAQSRASTRMERAAMATLRPARQAARAQVTGGSGIEFFGGAEFGAAQNQLRNTSRGVVRGWNQFKAWRGSGADAGYALYPGIRDSTERIVEVYGDEVMKITRDAFPE